MRWVLDAGMLERSVGHCRLDQAVQRAGLPCTVGTWTDLRTLCVEAVPAGEAFVAWGSMEFCKQLMRMFPEQGYYYGHTDNTQYLTYVTEMPEVPFLNHEAVATTWQQLVSRKQLWQRLMPGAGVFARPNSGYKTFAGQTLRYDLWDVDTLGLEAVTSVMPGTLTIVAPLREITGEFRFVVCDGRVVTGSEYRWDNVLDVRRDWPPECEELAAAVAGRQGWRLDTAYVVDVAQTPDGPRVIELNSFCHAGLYACDADVVVREITALARSGR